MRVKFLMVMLVTAVMVGAGCGDLPFLNKLINKKEMVVSQPQAPVAAAAPVVPPAASQPDPVAAIGGVYDVRGTNPGGSGNYSGTVMVSPAGPPDSFRLDWSVGTSYTGMGRRTGNTLSVEWGNGQTPVGVVNYIIEPDGRLTGSWYTNNDPNNLGSEILIPRR